MTTVRIPSPLRRYTQSQSKVDVSGGNIGEVIESLETQFPGIKSRLCDDNSQIKRYVNVFVNGEEIRTLQGIETPIEDRDEVTIVPAMAGGQ